MMKILKLRAHVWFWVTALYIGITGYIISFKYGGSALDINAIITFNIHDTYFVIDYGLFAITLCIFYFFLGIIYFTFYKLKIGLINWLVILHTAITVGAIFLNDIIINLFIKNDNILDNSTGKIELLATVLTIAVGLAQILFIFNLIIASIRHFRKRHEI